MWITKLDIAKGIVKLLKNGKKLPNSDEIAAIVKQFPSGTDSKIIREMQQKKAEESVMAIAEEWLDVLKPPENLQEDGDMITPELWKLTIKETLKVKDYHRVIDLSVVVEGLEAARDIVAKAKARAALEAQKKANAEWRAFEDVFTDAQRYRNRILAH